jgi:transposase-like protein
MLVVIDGAKALASAVHAVFDHPVVQRCQLHYAEQRIMPSWPRKSLRDKGFALLKSA